MVYCAEVVNTINVGAFPWGIAYDSAKGEIFVANSGNGAVHGTVSVISDSNNTVIETINVANGAASYTDSVISDITTTVVATINVGTFPWGVAYDSAKGEIFVTNASPGTVSVISDSTNTVIAQ